MRYTETKEQSAELLRKTLALLGQHDAPFHPVSFAVWYEYAAGTNPPLTQAVGVVQQTEPRLSDASVVRLYQNFVADVDPQAMDRITSRFQVMMAGVAESARQTGDQAGSFGAQLSGLSTAL